MTRIQIILFVATLVISTVVAELAWGLPQSKQPAASSEGIEFFESKIRPVFIRECYGCHSKKTGQSRGGLQVDTKSGLLLGGDSGPALVPGSLDDSPLWSAINYEDYEMPPSKQLSQDIIDDFREWIEMGAPDPRGQTKNAKVNSTVTRDDIKKGKQFWSFKTPVSPDPPTVNDPSWAKGAIDQFILAELESNDLTPSVDADPHTLLRRLCFDLIGLPPTPEQIDWFLAEWNKNQDAAVSKAVDHLLDSPRFGERWARHWLDVARYAESSGKELNATFPHAWRYRDYVIDSFNEDKPYDRFVREQIAGDLLPVKTDQQWAENLVATGFLAIGPKTLTEQNPRQFEMDLIDEQIDVSTRVVLGLSVACARCHDHKFDPIPQTDYYAMAGIFQSTETYYGTIDTQQNRRPSNLLVLPVDDPNPFDRSLSTSEIATLKKQLETATDEYRELQIARRQARRNPNVSSNPQLNFRQLAQKGTEVATTKALLNSFDDNGKPHSFCMGVQPVESPVNANLLIRGEIDQPAQSVPRGFVQVISRGPTKVRKGSTGRLELARWMTDENNPLTARVMANRIWQHLFGQGIVNSTENFGVTGGPPTHPELLDYLAIQFMQNQWSVKQLIREIANTRTYRVSSKFDQRAFEIDPDNKLLWRASPRRLDAEVLRDSMLSMSDNLDTRRPRASDVAKAGETVVRNGRMTNLASFVLENAMRSEPDRNNQMNSGNRRGDDRDSRRRRRSRRGQGRSMRNPYFDVSQGGPQTDPRAEYRSIYLPIVRDNIPRSLAVFDFAESSMVVGQRESSNTPDQGLYFLNNEFVIQQSDQLAAQLVEESSNLDEQIERAFLLAYGRQATDAEMEAAREFYEDFEPTSRRGSPELQKLSSLCQAIMAAAEFRIVN